MLIALTVLVGIGVWVVKGFIQVRSELVDVHWICSQFVSTSLSWRLCYWLYKSGSIQVISNIFNLLPIMTHVDFTGAYLLYYWFFVLLDYCAYLIRLHLKWIVNQMRCGIQADILLLFGSDTNCWRNFICSSYRIKLTSFYMLIWLQLSSFFLIAHLVVDHHNITRFANFGANRLCGLIAANSRLSD